MSFLRHLLSRMRGPAGGEERHDAGSDSSPLQPGIVADDVPRSFAEPISVVDLEALPSEPIGDGRIRVTFWANLRDATGGRCPDVAVDARIEGPDRTGSGTAWTDEYGQVRFRTTGPPGTYRCVITGAGAGALEVRRDQEGFIAVAEAAVG